MFLTNILIPSQKKKKEKKRKIIYFRITQYVVDKKKNIPFYIAFSCWMTWNINATMNIARMNISGEVSMHRAQKVKELSINEVAKTPPIWFMAFRGGLFRCPLGGGFFFFVIASWFILATESWPQVELPPLTPVRGSSSASPDQCRRPPANGWSFSNRLRAPSVGREVMFAFGCADWLEFVLLLLQVQWRDLQVESLHEDLSSVCGREEEEEERQEKEGEEVDEACEEEWDEQWVSPRLWKFESESKKLECKVVGAAVVWSAVWVTISPGIISAKTSSSSFDPLE